MPAFVNQPFGRRAPRSVALAVLVVFATAAVTSVAGYHAHAVNDAATGDATASAAAPCSACAMSAAPALPVPAVVGTTFVASVQAPVTDDAAQALRSFVEPPRRGRAPPAC